MPAASTQYHYLHPWIASLLARLVRVELHMALCHGGEEPQARPVVRSARIEAQPAREPVANLTIWRRRGGTWFEDSAPRAVRLIPGWRAALLHEISPATMAKREGEVLIR